MKVEVQLINEKGRSVSAPERSSLPTYRGVLRIQEGRNQSLGRVVVTAELLSRTDGSQPPLVPTLHDAGVLYVCDNQMRIRGFEVVDGAQYGQTWDVKVS